MTGMLARSRAGHDKDRLYLVVREEGEMLWLSDGTRRTLSNPKRKKRKHVQSAGRGFSQEEVERLFRNPAWGDNQIRERISRAEVR